MSIANGCDEVVLVFDTYKKDSLKNATGEKGRLGKDPDQYQVKDDTVIKLILMSRFLSHDQTKADLTDYLAEKILQFNKYSSQLVIISASGHTKSNGDISFEDNNHKEADTLIIFQAIWASARNPSNSQLTICSPDTDVLVLAIANLDNLLNNTAL